MGGKDHHPDGDDVVLVLRRVIRLLKIPVEQESLRSVRADSYCALTTTSRPHPACARGKRQMVLDVAAPVGCRSREAASGLLGGRQLAPHSVCDTRTPKIQRFCSFFPGEGMTSNVAEAESNDSLRALLHSTFI